MLDGVLSLNSQSELVFMGTGDFFNLISYLDLYPERDNYLYGYLSTKFYNKRVSLNYSNVPFPDSN